VASICTRTMFVCALDSSGEIVLERSLAAPPEAFLAATAHYRAPHRDRSQDRPEERPITEEERPSAAREAILLVRWPQRRR
jgi:hypothetical protein